MKTLADIQPFAELLAAHQKASCIAKGYTWEIHEPNFLVSVKLGGKYARVDVGSSGKYMVELATGDIYGIKGYGVIHRGHRFGNLSTINDWQWGEYRGILKASIADRTLWDSLGNSARVCMYKSGDEFEVYFHDFNDSIPSRFIGTIGECVERADSWITGKKVNGFQEQLPSYNPDAVRV